MDVCKESRAVLGDDGGSRDEPEQKEVAPCLVTVAEEADDENRGDPGCERDVPFAADEEAKYGGDGEVKVTFVVHEGLLCGN